ncbi:MAG TPA: MEDS domain-containing protein [Thermoanaerobaculia bacterium]|nr:MEDS domain-containing protein [Thermoanaerobaculia bacterium]
MDLDQRLAALRRGDHLCQMHRADAERRAALLPFFQGGLAAGERCVLLAPEAECRRVEQALGAAGSPAGGRVALVRCEDRPRGGGHDPGGLLDLLRQCEQQALEDGLAGVRLAIDMAWLFGAPAGGAPLDPAASGRLLAYEALLHRFVERSLAVVLCQYDLSRFPPGTQTDVLRTHPLALIGRHLCANFYYEPAEVVLGRAAPEDRAAWMVAQLERASALERKLEEVKDRLAEHRAALERAERRKEEFLAMLAHELRNPLGTISNALQVLRLTGAGREDTWQRALETAERQVRHQARLVDDLLEVQRVTRGEIELHCEGLELGELVRATVERLRPALEEGGVAVALELAEERLGVRGDPLRLAQAVENLMRNAGKFTPVGGRITVRVARSAGGRRAAVTVRDNGVGIGPELLPHVFEAFTQADHSLERAKGGLGVGLAVVKGLVELHGGEVQARSEGPGRGAQFTLLLPVEPSAPPGTAERPAPQDRQARRVLVVEDNADAAATLRDFLVLSGHEVALAHSGSAGVEAARQFHPEVVLCDLGLPGMDGYAVAAALRRDPVTRGARLIAVTGYGRDEDRRRSKEAGFDLHLTKPVDPGHLARLLA